MSGSARIALAIRRANDAGRPAIGAFLTAGFPSMEVYVDAFQALSQTADLIEIGVPFSDPMADGLTIQRSSRQALEAGVTLPRILDTLEHLASIDQLSCVQPHTPILLMSYLNPLMAYGFGRLAADARRADIAGLIVPDLPLEESGELQAAVDPSGLALVQMVSPATPAARLREVARASRGFVYAVTMRGPTGARVSTAAAGAYLERVRRASPLPVLAGFGIRGPADVAALAPSVDGVIVGSALMEALEEGRDPAAYVAELWTERPSTAGRVTS